MLHHLQILRLVEEKLIRVLGTSTHGVAALLLHGHLLGHLIGRWLLVSTEN